MVPDESGATLAQIDTQMHMAQRVLKGRLGLGVRLAFSIFYPDYVSEDDLFAELVTRHLRHEALVMDAGCGSGAHFRYAWKNRSRAIVGCDLSEAVSSNPNLSFGVRANLANLPFQNDAFGVVFCRYVLEHIEAPQVVFNELVRVLKNGGILIVLVPSRWHYVALLGARTPQWVHKLITSLRGNPPEDAFPTRYLANTDAELIRYSQVAGLSLVEYHTRKACPNYLLWSLPLFLFGVIYERVVNRLDCLSALRSNIIAAFAN